MAKQLTAIEQTQREVEQVIVRINMNIMRLAQLSERMEKHHIARVAAYKAHLTMAKNKARGVSRKGAKLAKGGKG